MTYDIMHLTASTVRSVIVAPPGKKLVVSDLSNIEGRGLAWQAGEEWKLQAFRDFDAGTGPDLYKLAYAKAFRIHPDEVDKFGRSVGKVMELGLGYAGGINAFVTFALVYGIDLEQMATTAWGTIPDDVKQESLDFVDWLHDKGTRWPMSNTAAAVCESFKRMWRNAHPMVVALWRELEDGFRAACKRPGHTFQYRGFKFRRDGAWLRILLPSGRCLCYPQPRIEEDGSLTFMGVNQFTRKWGRMKTYGGKLSENCIAEGTDVLTSSGWVPIQTVRASDWLWDGVEWVQSAGCIYSGNQLVYPVFGVEMTADHRVLTEEGWKNASSCEGHHRAACRLPGSGSVHWQQWPEVVVGAPLRLRQDEGNGPLGVQKTAAPWGAGVLRLHAEGDDSQEANLTRNVQTPGLRSVAVDDRPLPTSNAPGMAQLWRAGHTGLRALAKQLRKFLGGYGARLPQGTDVGADRQHGRLLQRELPVAEPQSASEQHTGQSLGHDTARPDDGDAGCRTIRHRVQHAAVPAGAWLAERAVVRAVWDIQDCGPRNRFVVRGADGAPVIVHNCTQSVARDFMFDALPGIEAAGYEIVLRVHDEVVTEAPDTPEFNADHLSQLLAATPTWGGGMPLAAAGWEGYRYKKG